MLFLGIVFVVLLLFDLIFIDLNFCVGECNFGFKCRFVSLFIMELYWCGLFDFLLEKLEDKDVDGWEDLEGILCLGVFLIVLIFGFGSYSFLMLCLFYICKFWWV